MNKGVVLAEWREAAETSFSDTDARDEYDRARAFLKRIGDLLLANGFTAEELRMDVLGSSPGIDDSIQKAIGIRQQAIGRASGAMLHLLSGNRK